MDESDGTPSSEVSRRLHGPDWFWTLVGILGIGQPIVDRESIYGDDKRNDPYRHDFDSSAKDD